MPQMGPLSKLGTGQHKKRIKCARACADSYAREILLYVATENSKIVRERELFIGTPSVTLALSAFTATTVL